MNMLHPARLASRLAPRLALWFAIAALCGACSIYDSTVYGNRPGTVEHPGSGAEGDKPTIYVVQRGDTLAAISRRFNVSEATIAQRNSLSPPYSLRVGQWLELPANNGTAAAPPPGTGGGGVQTAPLAPVPGTANAPPPGAANVPPASGGPTPVVPPGAAPKAPGPNVAAAPPPPTPAPASGLVKFDWPVRGQIIGRFGTQTNGVVNDGVNIAVAQGTPVKAAAAGQVVYAGEEVKGFGKLVLIAHADGYVTAYAHNDELLVTKGRAVAKGESIAKAGQSGGVSPAQLHFEIRRNNKAIDPMPLLGQ